MVIGHRLREVRGARGLSLKEAAKRSGFGERTLGAWERGEDKYSPNLEDLKKLAEVYNVGVEIFLESSGDLLSYKIQRNPPLLVSQNVEPAAFKKPIRLAPIINDIPAGFDYGSGDCQREAGNFDEAHPMATNNEHAFWMRVKGNSMEPDYEDGDLVAIEPVEPSHFADMDPRDVHLAVQRWDGRDVIYMLDSGHCAFKRFEIDPAGNYWFTCLNPAMAELKAGPYSPENLYRLWPVDGLFRAKHRR